MLIFWILWLYGTVSAQELEGGGPGGVNVPGIGSDLSSGQVDVPGLTDSPVDLTPQPGCGDGPAPGMRLGIVRLAAARDAVTALPNDRDSDPAVFVWCAAHSDVGLVDLDEASTSAFFDAALSAGAGWIRADGPMMGAQSPAPTNAEAWDLNPVIRPDDTRTGAGVDIFVVDSGISSSSVSGVRLGAGACFTDGQCPGRTASRCIDSGAQPVCGVCDPGSAACGHGTTISLLAGAQKPPLSPSTERQGVAPDATARHVRLLVDDGFGHAVGREADLVQAVDWITGQVPASPAPKPVVNLSLTLDASASVAVCAAAATPSTSDDPGALTSLLALVAKGAVVVAAAGPPVFDEAGGEVTLASGAPTFEWAPACVPGVMSVAGADRHGTLADWSNPGDLLAPGGPLMVRGPDRRVAGSSYAAGYVSGLYAVLLGAGLLPANPTEWRAAVSDGRCPKATGAAPSLCSAELR